MTCLLIIEFSSKENLFNETEQRSDEKLESFVGMSGQNLLRQGSVISNCEELTVWFHETHLTCCCCKSHSLVSSIERMERRVSRKEESWVVLI